MARLCPVLYKELISIDNLLLAWREFARGKGRSRDVQAFRLRLGDNILQLHADLASGSYRHGGYQVFNISDPKPRTIHKASVRDRLVHHAIHRVLYAYFDAMFIADSYSCRKGRGVHKALERFAEFARRAGRNHTRTAWVLKCDVRRFFASIDHDLLKARLARQIPDAHVLRLLAEVIDSFHAEPGKGLPLGNLTSQLLCNVYMDALDKTIKHRLKVRTYVRYCDDFVVIGPDKAELMRLLRPIEDFLRTRLRLQLHPDKVTIETIASGVDFLGWVHFPHHRALRAATRRRLLVRIGANPTPAALASYLGLLGHGDAFGVRQELLNAYGLWEDAAERQARRWVPGFATASRDRSAIETSGLNGV